MYSTPERVPRRPRPFTPGLRPIGPLRHPRLLVVGCGDVGLRVLALLQPHLRAGRMRVITVSRAADACADARLSGARALKLDLDRAAAARRLGPLAACCMHLAPPPSTGADDPRLRRLLLERSRARAESNRAWSFNRKLRQNTADQWVLASTTGVYGNCDGARISETRPAAPTTARARRRVAAESVLRQAVRTGSGGSTGAGTARLKACILRIPGIYAADRLPVQRIAAGTPVPDAEHDPYTNHIHADDLARILYVALYRGRTARVVNAVDDSELTIGQWFDLVAAQYSLPAPPRLDPQALAARVSPMALSFMQESRRINNQRLKRELRVRLRWPTVQCFLAGPDGTAKAPVGSAQTPRAPGAQL